MSRFWSAIVADLSPYVPGEQPKRAGLVKLNTNEHPYPPSPAVREAIRAELGEGAEALRLYPDPQSSVLCATIAAREGLAPEQVFVGGNGVGKTNLYRALELIRAALIATCAEVTADDVMKIDRLTKASPRPELAEPRCGRTGR